MRATRSHAREQLADARDRESLAREQRFDGSIARSGLGPRRRAAVDRDRDPRARRQRQRDQATVGRQAAARDRAAAAIAWGPQPYGPKLLASFADVARQLIGSDNLTDVLRQVLTFTVQVVPGCDGASITLWRDGRAAGTLATSPAAGQLDDISFEGGLGPGPDALDSEHPVYVPQLADLRQVPALAAAATRLGMASALCTGLFAHQATHWAPLGVFSVYGAAPDAFTAEDREFTSILAAYIAVAAAMANRREEVDRREAALHRGLSTRDVIGQAKGILMERQHLSAGDAFDVLRRASQRLNIRLADLATHLAETGELPSGPPTK